MLRKIGSALKWWWWWWFPWALSPKPGGDNSGFLTAVVLGGDYCLPVEAAFRVLQGVSEPLGCADVPGVVNQAFL